MKWVFWIDAQLLKIVQKLANGVNVLTGKDNFWMAKQAAFLAAVFWILENVLEAKSINIFALILFGAGYFVIPLVWIKSIERQEIFRERLRISNVKPNPLLDAIMRLVVLALELFGMTNSAHRHGWKWLDVLGYLSLILMIYLIGIDKPPYSKSKVWEWLSRPKPVLQPSQVKS
ncbi:MAG: hypothetical protein KW788_01545 [Candidatus Doudnabacteria bacterium]|nr:hypothetical protein [Candidatus Doudnabacteria bacterium]